LCDVLLLLEGRAAANVASAAPIRVGRENGCLFVMKISRQR
jgi:hypothetical protein